MLTVVPMIKQFWKPLQRYPNQMRQLTKGSNRSSAHFKEYIRSHNSALSFAFMGAQVTPFPLYRQYYFRIHGQIYHNTSHLHPYEVGNANYAQLFIFDSDTALWQRMNKRNNLQCKKEIMSTMLSDIIPYAHAIQMLHELEERFIAE